MGGWGLGRRCVCGGGWLAWVGMGCTMAWGGAGLRLRLDREGPGMGMGSGTREWGWGGPGAGQCSQGWNVLSYRTHAHAPKPPTRWCWLTPLVVLQHCATTLPHRPTPGRAGLCVLVGLCHDRGAAAAALRGGRPGRGPRCAEAGAGGAGGAGGGAGEGAGAQGRQGRATGGCWERGRVPGSPQGASTPPCMKQQGHRAARNKKAPWTEQGAEVVGGACGGVGREAGAPQHGNMAPHEAEWPAPWPRCPAGHAAGLRDPAHPRG